MTAHPDGPQPPVTTGQLEGIRDLARTYVRECSDEPPLTPGEQGLALALAGAMPTRTRAEFGEGAQAELAWVVACCWFLRQAHPRNDRRAAPPLYAALDRLELEDPGEWASVHADVEQLLRDHGVDAGRREGQD